MRCGAAREGADAGRQARALLAFAVRRAPASSHVADLTDRIEEAEARAVVIWRGERIPYRAGAATGSADISDRAERNALYDSLPGGGGGHQPAPRGAAGERIARQCRDLGMPIYAALIEESARLRPRCAGGRGAPLPGRFGDALLRRPAPLPGPDRDRAGRRHRRRPEHLMRGEGWDHWFDGAPHAAGRSSHPRRARHRPARPAGHHP